MIQCTDNQIHIYDVAPETGTVTFFSGLKEEDNKKVVVRVTKDVRYDVCLSRKEWAAQVETKPFTYPYWECHLANVKAGTTVNFRDVCTAASLNAETKSSSEPFGHEFDGGTDDSRPEE